MARRTPAEGVHRRTPLETVARQELFGGRELAVLGEARPLAEELVGEHFQLTSFGPHQHLYEIVTLGASGPECRASRALAQLCRFDRGERIIDEIPRISRFYRICLQDDNILRRVEEGYRLAALFIYVLTHELIHIVRFESFEVIYDAAENERAAEEHRVDRLTRDVLASLKDREVDDVLTGLARGRVDVLAAAE